LGFDFERIEWEQEKRGTGLLWWSDEPRSNIEIYSEPSGAASSDDLREFAKQTRRVVEPGAGSSLSH
jgi:hypothetical protein